MNKITNIDIKPNGEKWGYNSYTRQWAMLDKSNNIIREYVNNDGYKMKYFDLHGYQPHTFKEHLDKDGKADAYAQMDYCESVDCPDCYYCVWVSHMHLPPNPNKPKVKSSIIKNRENKKPYIVNKKWEKLAKKVSKERVKSDDDHPLLDYVIKKFKGRVV